MTDHTELLARHREQWTGKQHHGLTFGDLNILIELQAAVIRGLIAASVQGTVLVPMPTNPSIKYLEWFVGRGLCCGNKPYKELVDAAKLKYMQFLQGAFAAAKGDTQ